MPHVLNQFDFTRENIQNKGLTPSYKNLGTAIASLIQDQDDALSIFEYVVFTAENLAGLVTNSSEGFEEVSSLMSDADYKLMQQAIDKNFESWQFIHKLLLELDLKSYSQLEVRQNFDRVNKVIQGHSIAILDTCENDDVLFEMMLTESNILHELQEMLKGLQIFYENCSFSKSQKEILQQSQYSPSSSNQFIDRRTSMSHRTANWLITRLIKGCFCKNQSTSQ